MSYHVMTSGAKKRMTKKIYFSHNLEIIKNERGYLMKIKTSYLVYAVIATVFAGLSMFTDIFEKGNFEAIFLKSWHDYWLVYLSLHSHHYG